MRIRALTILCLLILLMVAPTGCGGGGQSEDGSQGDGGGKKAEKSKKGPNVPELTTASGTLGRVDTEKGLLTLRPEGDDKPLRFRFNPDAVEVEVDGEDASPEDLSGGQKAELGYFERNDKKVARTVSAKGPGFATASGTLGVVDTEKGRLTLRPEEGDEPLRFGFNPDGIRVTLNRKEASPEELRGGQKAEVRYAERDGRKVAHAVNAQSQ